MSHPPATTPRRLAVIGGGPAGLMAAEVARAAGCEVDLYERKGSVGRKLLIAGKGGLNLTHSEPRPAFDARYAERVHEVGVWLEDFDAAALRAWARSLGVDTVIGSSGRVFPADLKAAPLLRGWVRRLRAQGVRFHVEHDCAGWRRERDEHGDESFTLDFTAPSGPRATTADAIVLALGGASWPQLGSDGRWTRWLAARGVDVAPLQPSNCGFDADWSDHFAQRHAGAPLKPVTLHWRDAGGGEQQRQGELIATATGLEGGLIYAASPALRDAIAREGSATIHLDLAPQRDHARLQRDLAAPRGKRSLGEHLRRAAHLDGVRVGLLHESLGRARFNAIATDAAALGQAIKHLPITLHRARPIEEAISSAGGIRFDALDDSLMLAPHPGVFAAGEMLDWEAPTGGYLLTACFASGHRAGRAAADWLRARS